jgi:hypothetical protein
MQTAYNDALTGDTLLIHNGTLAEALDLNLPVSVFIRGGYDCDFIDNISGISTITGDMTIQGGSINIENIALEVQ